jgi:hypothetical protein
MDSRIENLIDEYYFLYKGEFISDVDEYLYLEKMIGIRRRLLKHIVEQRKGKDSMNQEEIKKMMRDIPDALKNKEFEIANPKQNTFPGSKMIGKMNHAMRKGLIVIKSPKTVDAVTNEFEEIFDAFYREEKRFNKLKDGMH